MGGKLCSCMICSLRSTATASRWDGTPTASEAGSVALARMASDSVRRAQASYMRAFNLTSKSGTCSCRLEPRETIIGQVCCTRALSKRLVVLDVFVSSETHALACGTAQKASGADAARFVPPPPVALPPGAAGEEDRWVVGLGDANDVGAARVLEVRDSIR